MNGLMDHFYHTDPKPLNSIVDVWIDRQMDRWIISGAFLSY